MVPLFRQIYMKISLRPENPPVKAAPRASQCDIAAFSQRVNATAATEAMNIFRHKAGFRSAFANKSQSVGIPGDLQILTPKFYIPTRTTYTLRGCPMREATPFWRKKARSGAGPAN